MEPASDPSDVLDDGGRLAGKGACKGNLKLPMTRSGSAGSTSMLILGEPLVELEQW